MLSTACPHSRVDRFRVLYTNATAETTQTGYASVSIGAPIFRRETRENARFFPPKFAGLRTPPPFSAPGFRTHLSTVFFNRSRPRVNRACERSYRIVDNCPHRLSTAMTRSYGKLYYCALNQCFLGSRSLRFATSASRRPLPHRQRVYQCDSSVVLRHPNRSRKRRVRRCSPILPKASVGTASGRPTRTTFAARKTRATWPGSVSPMTSRLRAQRSPARECWPSGPPSVRERECRWWWRDRRTAIACWSAVPDDPSDDQRTLNEILRAGARAARCATRPRAERPRRANRSWHRGAGRRRRRRGRG